MVALQQSCFYPTDLVSSPKWGALFTCLAPELTDIVSEQGLARLWAIFVGGTGACKPARPPNISWVPTALSLLVNQRFRRRIQNGLQERGKPWTSDEVRRGLGSSFKRLLTNPNLQDGNLPAYVACNFLHEHGMPRDSAPAAVCPRTTPPPPHAPRAKTNGNGKGSGAIKAAHWKACKDASLPTSNLFDALNSLEDTESLSDESLRLEEDSEDASAVSADDVGSLGFVVKGIDTPPALVDMLARLHDCLPDIASREVERDVAQHVEDLLRVFMELRAQVDQSAAPVSGMLIDSNTVAGPVYAKSQGLFRLLFDVETSSSTFESAIEVMLSVYWFIESACPSGAYLDGLTMVYFHRQVDMAYSLKGMFPAGQGGTLFVQTISVLSCGVLLLSILTGNLCSESGRPHCADSEYLALLANSVADSLCMA
ncbi:hypothetical protein DUNSADRAFT_5273 [Dunaliella salina]|uniref:Uncharacterized protein n=1 Tax=Dunaliella salina TaxID=3046 RepID=A0ABQ7GQJ1_DUNSA|nr:hypothetical protein DUNSADRAFT_5273 [Dunaliella salina]|eukprot:KAF5836881.1 hypothetical protein DUNSADRAFT_5273 [Dunaliella salina]